LKIRVSNGKRAEDGLGESHASQFESHDANEVDSGSTSTG
jgi:hypothetical protein